MFVVRSIVTRRVGRCFTQKSFKNDSEIQGFGNVLGGEQSSPVAMDTFKAWHNVIAVFAESDSARKTAINKTFEKCVHDKCKFYAPTYFKNWEGKDEFLLIISSVGEVFGKSFKYGRQWISPNGHDWALEFSAEIGSSKMKIDGIDLVKLDEHGQIVEFRVLARPPNAVAELKKEMMQRVPSKLVALKARQLKDKLFG